MHTPILKAMPGDYQGLVSTHPDLWGSLTPHFLIQKPKSSEPIALESYLYEVGLEISQAWPRGRFYVDIPRFKQEWRVTDNRHPLLFLHERIAGLGAKAVVVVGLERDDNAFLTTGFAAAKMNQNGLCIRIEKLDLEDPYHAREMLSLRIEQAAIAQKQIDLLIDCGDLQIQGLAELRSRVLDFLSLVPDARAFRSVTLAGTSIPQTFSKFPRFQSRFIPRLEFALWLSLRKAGLEFLEFGDYGANNTRPIDRDKKIHNVLAKVRYSVPGAWLIVAGHVLKGNGGEQYHELSKLVVNTPQFRSSDNRWAHNQIKQCAHREVSGSPTNQIAIDTCNHIQFICEHRTADVAAAFEVAV